MLYVPHRRHRGRSASLKECVVRTVDPRSRSEHLMGTRSHSLAAGKYSKPTEMIIFKLDGSHVRMKMFLKAVSI